MISSATWGSAGRAFSRGLERGVLTGWHFLVEGELRQLLEVPRDVGICATITLGRPRGRHGPVRRRPISELVYLDGWGRSAPFAFDPPGSRYTSAGPPSS